MNRVARELRDLALEIEHVCQQSRAHSVAHEYVRSCVDYLTLRARVMELEDQRNASDWGRAASPPGDDPGPRPSGDSAGEPRAGDAGERGQRRRAGLAAASEPAATWGDAPAGTTTSAASAGDGDGSPWAC